MTSLLDNLSIAWTGDFDSLRKFTSNELKLDGNWEQPDGDKKIFNSENISITWRKAKSILNIEGVEAGKIIYLLCAQLCKNTDSTIQSGNTNYSNSSCQTDLTNLQSCCHKSSDVHIGHQQTPKKPLENDIFKN
jgi:hypothetical protein